MSAAHRSSALTLPFISLIKCGAIPATVFCQHASPLWARFSHNSPWADSCTTLSFPNDAIKIFPLILASIRRLHIFTRAIHSRIAAMSVGRMARSFEYASQACKQETAARILRKAAWSRWAGILAYKLASIKRVVCRKSVHFGHK